MIALASHVLHNSVVLTPLTFTLLVALVFVILNRDEDEDDADGDANDDLEDS